MFNKVKLKWPLHGIKVTFREQEVDSAFPGWSTNQKPPEDSG